MRLLRLGLLGAGSLVAWRAVRGRGDQVVQRATEAGRALGLPVPGERDTETGSHPSAASAANDEYRDDRDVVGVGLNPLPGDDLPPGATP